MEYRGHVAGGPAPGLPEVGTESSRHTLWIAIVLVVALLLLPAVLAVWAHNQMLGRAEAVEAAWAQVESNFQRRADLLPRLVETVNRYVRHESELLTAVVHERAAARAATNETFAELDRAQKASADARAALGGAPPDDAARLQALSQHEATVGRGVRAVLAVAESYPELRSADQFLELQAQLEGSENRINVARMGFNDAVRDYNAALVQLPTSVVAQARALERKPYFRADESARVASPLGFE
jgi:LemA protein